MTDEKYRGVIIDSQLKLNGASAMNADLTEVTGGGTAESIVMWQSP